MQIDFKLQLSDPSCKRILPCWRIDGTMIDVGVGCFAALNEGTMSELGMLVSNAPCFHLQARRSRPAFVLFRGNESHMVS